MSKPVLKVAVVGHTNTGKTSLLRTLTRDATFGEISNRPSTTRHVEGTALLVDGQPVVELFDTPGLEDSIGLLDHLDSLRQDRHADPIDLILQFLDSPAATGEFEQEAKALRQVMAGDLVLYVIDARDRVLGKHRDELEILGRCARPVVPVLNFVASPEAKTAQWRDHLARVNMHAVVEFDTVVLDERGERRLFEKMQTLLDHFHGTLEAVIREHKEQRERLRRAAAELLADLLIDAAALVITASEDEVQGGDAVEHLKQRVRRREQQCVEGLLEIFRFRADDYAGDDLPISEGQWGSDLFSVAALKEFGIRAGGAAAAGGMAGLAVDALLGGASLGAGAAMGATLGALWSTAQGQGRKLADWLRGYTELRVNDATLRLLAVRQIELVRALQRRGHASQNKIRVAPQEDAAIKTWVKGELPAVIAEARLNPEWSRLNGELPLEPDGERLAAQESLSTLFQDAFLRDKS